ncbi:MAG: hypothetical protein RMM29_06490 [Planctomycetota bacterium]|nr:hypothetical protein [Planctomycetota bacterium]MCX8040518.1 hypothetical protein [Planctomycetota bacterium]MDW8373279.1 hypothetical protein [Planctomycetota bacterium]
MSLQHIPVTLPYTLVGDPTAALFTMQVDAVATSPTGAAAVSQVLVESVARMRHPGVGARAVIERVRVGAGSKPITGLYAYVLANSFHVARLDFPSRIEQAAAQELADTLAGLDQRAVFGIIADCVHLAYISSMGLAALASAAGRVPVRLLRPPATIVKVMDMVGLSRFIPIFPDLRKACDDLVATWLTQRTSGTQRVVTNR